MAGPRPPGPKRAVPAGARRPWRPSWVWLVIALGILAAGISLLAFPPSVADAGGAATRASVSTSGATRAGSVTSAASAPSVGAPFTAASTVPFALRPAMPVAAAPARDISRVRDPNGDLTPDISDFVNKGEQPTMAEVIDRLQQAGVTGGLAAFSPPGTRPPLIGLAVPEDFVLPEGYVRHYQATDDGQRIEPILMFSPDHAFVDAANRPIEIPKDRVVPPEFAPPGLPIRRVVIPAPAEPGR
jgi:hypothetical protein